MDQKAREVRQPGLLRCTGRDSSVKEPQLEASRGPIRDQCFDPDQNGPRKAARC